jgi:cholesterol oxidase
MPATSVLGNIGRAIRHVFTRLLGGASLGRLGFVFTDLFKKDMAYRSAVLLCMGLDKGNGVMRLDDNGFIEVDWPYRENMGLYNAILKAAKDFGNAIGARAVLALPNWWWPVRNNVTVHALGGCTLADSAKSGVTSAAAASLGQVFGYTGLYVADGSIVPTALGANPTATITALSEMIAEAITGISPTDDL